MTAPQSAGVQMRARARAHRRRFLRHLGCRASDLDAVARERLACWAAAQAALEHESVGTSRYWVATKVTRSLLRELEAAVHGRDRGDPAGGALAAYLRERNGAES